MPKQEVQGPTKERYLKSYEKRRASKDAIEYPPEVPGVKDAIDVHCHCDQGHQDGPALAKHATRNGMGGILYKSIACEKSGVETVKELRENLNRWADQEKLQPTDCWVGYVMRGSKGPSLENTRKQVEAGAIAYWMPVAMHANTLSKIGGRKSWWDPSASRNQLTAPLSWEEALEIFAMAEEIEKIGFKRAVVDHPFSPFVDLAVEQMKQLAKARIYMNFTYDELSPLPGVDPALIGEAIRAMGVERAILSSDAGEPLFPNSVECMRLMRDFMRALGLQEDEVHRATVTNPAAIVAMN